MKKCFFALILISISLGQDILITQANEKFVFLSTTLIFAYISSIIDSYFFRGLNEV